MPAPEEQGYEPEPSHVPMSDGRAASLDPPRARDRPAAGSAEDLAQRQNRLLPGHPSSRFEDDGTPRPPLVPLKNLELPEPGEDREHNGAGREQAARNGRPGSGAENGQADRGAWATGGDEPAADTADADTADADTADADTADADIRDAQHATLDDEPSADNPAPAEAAEAKRAEALTPEQVRIAVRAHGRCRLAEGRSVFGTYGESGLTPAMRRIEEDLDHGKLVPDTEKYALKSLDRFQEKLAKRIARFPDADAADLADEIHDGVRYTFIFDADNYVDGITDTRDKIEAEGYSLIEMKPSWHSDEYKGVNSRWRDNSSGSLFEVQWHTPASWEAKQKTHDAYEQIDRIGISVEEVERLRAYQREVCASVPVPPGALEMRGYKKES
jgi:hypothetical protein